MRAERRSESLVVEFRRRGGAGSSELLFALDSRQRLAPIQEVLWNLLNRQGDYPSYNGTSGVAIAHALQRRPQSLLKIVG